MKKYLLIFVPVVLVSLIILVTLNIPQKYKADFNLNVDVNSLNNEITSKLVNNTRNDYKIEDLIKNYLNTLTKTDLSSTKYSGDINKYLVRFPSMSLDEYDDFYNNSKYKDYSDGYISLNAIHMLFYSREFKYKDLKNISYDYISKDEIITKVYLNDVSLKYSDKVYTLDSILELSIRYEDESKQYKIFNINIEWVRDLEDYLNKIDDTERSINNKKSSALNNIVSYVPSGYSNLNYDKLKKLNSNIINKIYNDNKNSIVVLNAVNDKSLPTGNATGFFIKEGIVVTTYKSLYTMIDNDSVRIYADLNGKFVLVDGVVAVYPSLNVAILKLKEEVGTPVKIGDSEKIQKNDPVIIISSSIGLTSTVKTGIYINTIKDDIKILRTSLPLANGDTGSPIFDTEGLVIGINNDVKTNDDLYYSGINNSIDIEVLKNVIESIKNTSFSNLKITELSNLKKNNTKTVNKVPEKIWNKYLKLPVITNYVPLELYSAYTKEKYLIVRYKLNDDLIDTNTILKIYSNNLIKEGYEQKLINVYKKDNIKLSIKTNLGFIIIIVEGVN